MLRQVGVFRCFKFNNAGSIICLGTVAEVDHDAPPRIRVRSFGLLMTWRPWVKRLASTTRT
ncbi:hypothetical protein GO998_04655 [Ralstonia syzygii]|uniref:Uncharacterized protein n=1 Tax=Ralstonia syzygii TaxID=28097 RepID=A0ABX7ZDR7_9RALS|nr:hypothetical protein GO998_04655 [Ralstonia syzygii]